MAKSIAFSEGLHNPGPVFSTKDVIDDLLRGQATQLEEKGDSFITEEVKLECISGLQRETRKTSGQ